LKYGGFHSDEGTPSSLDGLFHGIKCPGKNGRKIARKQAVAIWSQPHEMLLHYPRDITPINHMKFPILGGEIHLFVGQITLKSIVAGPQPPSSRLPPPHVLSVMSMNLYLSIRLPRMLPEFPWFPRWESLRL
jgi:hypothetical protein